MIKIKMEGEQNCEKHNCKKWSKNSFKKKKKKNVQRKSVRVRVKMGKNKKKSLVSLFLLEQNY